MPSQALAPVSYEAIKAVRVLSSAAALPMTIQAPEAAGQTNNYGVPLRLVAGFVQPCTFVAGDIVYGVAAEPGHNLTTSGTPQQENEGSPPNQPNAVTTAIGAWMRLGTMGTYGANGQTVFSIALKTGQTFTQALVAAGVLYGLTKDNASGFWFMDTTVTNGNSAVAELLGVDSSCPNTAAGGCRVFFQFAAAKRYFQ